MLEAQRKFECYDCKHEWEVPYVQADHHNIRNAGVPIFTGTLLTKEAEEPIVPGVEGERAFVEHKEHEEIK